MTTQFRRFYLQRTEDVSGVSGTGRICDGVQFPDGHVAIHWTGSTWPTTTAHTCMQSVIDTHGHNGATRVVWVEDPLAARLARIAQAHTQHVDQHGGTTGDCTECGEPSPCPTSVWATTDRDPLAAWDPADDEPETPDRETVPCPAAVLKRPHLSHSWQPQPGMRPVLCAGVPAAPEGTTR